MWQQLPALLGVGVGVLASYLVAGAGERARWRRSQQARWVERRLDAYQQYGYAVKKATTLAMRVAAARGFDAGQETMPVEEGLAALAEAEAERSARWEMVLLVGDPATVTAARRWQRKRAWQMEQFARGQASDVSEWQESVGRARATRQAYYAAARRDLGVGSGDLPDPPVVGPGAHQRPVEPT